MQIPVPDVTLYGSAADVCNRSRTCAAQHTSHALRTRNWCPVEVTGSPSNSITQSVLSFCSLLIHLEEPDTYKRNRAHEQLQEDTRRELLYGVVLRSTTIIAKTFIG